MLIRCLFMIAGVALLSDTALPIRDEVVESTRHWRWIAWAVGGVLIALAIGWLRADDEAGSIGLA